MLIPLQYLIDKYHPKFKGVIHCGIHWGEEIDDYKKAGIREMFLIEPCTEAFNKCVSLYGNDWPILFSNFAVGSSYERVKMNTASFNKGESNSILQPKLHLQQHPEVVFDGEEEVIMTTLDLIFQDGAEQYNLLAMDVQGYEGEVLKGATETLKHIDYVYTEVNKGETYAGNMLIEGIDELLKDFKRVETKWAGNTTWGDAFYVRRTLL